MYVTYIIYHTEDFAFIPECLRGDLGHRVSLTSYSDDIATRSFLQTSFIPFFSLVSYLGIEIADQPQGDLFKIFIFWDRK